MKRFEILTCGVVTVESCCETIIRAIAVNAPIRENTNYRIFSPMEWHVQNHFMHIAAQLGVTLECNPNPTDPGAAAAIARADVVTCLCPPDEAEHYTSTIKVMQRGKATIVADVGRFSRMPDDCTIKVDPDNAFRDLLFAMNKLSSDADLCRSMGNAAKRWAGQVSALYAL